MPMWWAQCRMVAGNAETVAILQTPRAGEQRGEFTIAQIYAPKFTPCPKCGRRMSGADSRQHSEC